MPNLHFLTQLPSGITLNISADADWTDQFYQPQPVWPADPMTTVGVLSSTSTLVTGIATTGSFAIGMPVGGIGVAPGSIVTAITSDTEIQLSLAPLKSLAAASLTLWPPPLDLTGLTFRSQI